MSNVKHWRDDARRATSPLFNDNKLKLGVFSHNGTGPVQTTAPDGWEPGWRETLAVSLAADRAGLEAVVPYARWRGYLPEKPTHRSGYVLDPYTWAAGMAQATERTEVFCTSHVATTHPLAAAKQCATIDHIAGGRFALNVVAGWNKLEFDMFGAEMKEHDDRYDQAAEWIELLRRLWSDEDGFDYDGQYYRLRNAVSMPKPLQKPFPPIMNAGGSGKGQKFAAKYADMAFVMLKGSDPSGWRAQVKSYRDLAREEYGREMQVWSFASVLQRDTQDEVDSALRHYSVDHLDVESLDAFMAIQGMHTQLFPPEQFAFMRKAFAQGGGFPLFGSPEQIVDRLHAVADAGIDGMLLTWFDYADGLSRWTADVLPLLEQAGLRNPLSAS